MIGLHSKSEGVSELKKMRIYISGHVQGVGFRYTTKQKADELGVKGIVRNEADGSVYVEAFGTSQQMDQFIAFLQKGPAPFSHVENLKVIEDDTLENYQSFRISN